MDKSEVTKEIVVDVANNLGEIIEVKTLEITESINVLDVSVKSVEKK